MVSHAHSHNTNDKQVHQRDEVVEMDGKGGEEREAKRPWTSGRGGESVRMTARATRAPHGRTRKTLACRLHAHERTP